MSETPPKKRYRRLFPKTLGECVEPLTRPVFKAQGIASSRLMADWDKIVGQALASRCLPQKLSFPKSKNTDGTLTIAVENGFAPEIQHHQPIIIEKLASYFGYKAVSRISISQSYLPAKILPNTPKKTKAPALCADCVSVAQSVGDEELKTALASFAGALSARARSDNQ